VVVSNTPGPPTWLVQGGTVLIGCLLTFHVVFDALSDPYSNPTLSLGLLGAFGLALGFKKSFRDGDGG
jgi:hypothetical protein